MWTNPMSGQTLARQPGGNLDPHSRQFRKRNTAYRDASLQVNRDRLNYHVRP